MPAPKIATNKMVIFVGCFPSIRLIWISHMMLFSYSKWLAAEGGQRMDTPLINLVEVPE